MRVTRNNDYEQFYYTIQGADELVKKIIYDRQHKLHKYGISDYRNYMRKNINSNKSAPGFWKQARLAIVKDGNIEYRKKW